MRYLFKTFHVHQSNCVSPKDIKPYKIYEKLSIRAQSYCRYSAWIATTSVLSLAAAYSSRGSLFNSKKT